MTHICNIFFRSWLMVIRRQYIATNAGILSGAKISGIHIETLTFLFKEMYLKMPLQNDIFFGLNVLRITVINA